MLKEFHEELANKSKDVERVIKALSGSASKKSIRGSAGKLNDLDSIGPKAAQLQAKWRTVWKISVDRNKKLQQVLNRLHEVGLLHFS